MSYTAQTLANDAFERIKVSNPRALASLIPRLMTMIPAALELLADRIRMSDGYRGLQTDFSVTPNAGVADLSALTGILFDINRSSVRVASSNLYLTPIDDVLTLRSGGLPSDQVYYAPEGSTLRFRSTTPMLTDYVTPVKIRANYIPSLTDAALPFPSQYEGNVLEILASLEAMNQAEQMSVVGRA